MPVISTQRLRRALYTAPIALVLLTAASFWAGPAPTLAQDEIAAEQNFSADPYASHDFYDATALSAFYTDRDDRPVWVQGYGPYQPKAKALVDVLEQAWTHGLNPKKYNLDQIQVLLDDPKNMNRFELDLLLSDAVIRYGRDLTGMRIDPGTGGKWSKYWREPMSSRQILDRVAKANNVESALAGLEPKGKLYGALRRELVSLLEQPEEGFQPISLDGLLRPGDGHKKVADIRLRMGLTDEDATDGKFYYDDRLAKAVMDFQRDNGLDPDGVVGNKTISLLNVSREDRINQVVANLERLRWIDQDKPDHYVLVNIPSAHLWGVENGKVVLEMPVIVGKAVRPTKSFKTEITGVRFNPNWTVPPTIKKVDFLPELKQDPYYLTNRGIEISQRGQTIDPGSVDWNSISWSELNAMRMVQNPGRSNPLGRVRVIMPNPYDIYLHDTNKPQYFEKQDRTLSSGCIRVAEPEKLANFIMKSNKGWTEEKTTSILNTGRLTEVVTENKIPVYILYQTVWQDENGQIVYGRDVYGRDRELAEELSEIDGFRLPDILREAANTPKMKALRSPA